MSETTYLKRWGVYKKAVYEDRHDGTFTSNNWITRVYKAPEDWNVEWAIDTVDKAVLEPEKILIFLTEEHAKKVRDIAEKQNSCSVGEGYWEALPVFVPVGTRSEIEIPKGQNYCNHTLYADTGFDYYIAGTGADGPTKLVATL